MNQPHPNVTNADVERVVRRDFPADSYQGVIAMLNANGEHCPNGEHCRVLLAALKLSCGDVRRLRLVLDAAKRDYRDVIAPAEYFLYEKMIPGPGRVPPEEEQRIIDADWAQYQNWLNG
jgi:hypothetical protein